MPDGSFEWRAPFHKDLPIPWLDAEHDVGPAVVQIFKDGLRKWKDDRYVSHSIRFTLLQDWSSFSYSIALAFELLTPTRVCLLFSRALRRPVRYIQDPKIEVEVPIPQGYEQQLRAIEVIFGKHRAPYFGPDLETQKYQIVNGADPRHGDAAGDGDGEGTVIEEARRLWGGWRGIEEYAREVFPVEEAANGRTCTYAFEFPLVSRRVCPWMLLLYHWHCRCLHKLSLSREASADYGRCVGMNEEN